MKRIAKFHKVSLEQFMEGWKDTFGEQYTEDQIKALYEEIKLPKRATAGSAGYDFYAPDDFVIDPGKTIKIPTGIRNGRKLGAQMLSEKRTWIQVPSAAE